MCPQMFAELVEVFEMPWRLILGVAHSQFNEDTVAFVDRVFAHPHTANERQTGIAEKFMRMATRSREEARMRMDLIDEPLMDALTKAYESHYHKHARELLQTHAPLQPDVRIQYELYKTACVEAVCTWAERVRPYFPDEVDAQTILDNAPRICRLVLDHFPRTGFGHHAAFLNKALLEDLRDALEGTKAGLREVSRCPLSTPHATTEVRPSSHSHPGVARMGARPSSQALSLRGQQVVRSRGSYLRAVCICSRQEYYYSGIPPDRRHS